MSKGACTNNLPIWRYIRPIGTPRVLSTFMEVILVCLLMDHEKSVPFLFRVNALLGTDVSAVHNTVDSAFAFSGASFAVPLVGFDPTLIRPQAMDSNFGFVLGGEPAGVGSGFVAS